MSDRWAVINAETLMVDNVVIWGGGESLWPGKLTVLLEEREPCAPGWSYNPIGTPRFEEPAQNTQDVE